MLVQASANSAASGWIKSANPIGIYRRLNLPPDALPLRVARAGNAVKRENGGKTGNNRADRTAPLTATLLIYGESVARMTALVSIVRMLTHSLDWVCRPLARLGMHSDWQKHLPAMLVFTTYAGFGACGDSWAADRTGTSNNLTDQLGALEERSYAAWKSGETTFWKSFLADQFVAWGSAGRLDGRTAVPALGGGGCHIDSYRLTDIQVTALRPPAAVLTHRTDVNGVCHGKALVPAYYTATVFVHEGKEWKAAFRAQSAIVDPMSAVRPAASALWTDGPTRGDADTQRLLGREQLMVSAWKDHDAGRMDKFFGPESSS